jgi:hypothetical protein
LLHSGIVIKNEIKEKQFEKKSIWDIQKVSDEMKLSELG